MNSGRKLLLRDTQARQLSNIEVCQIQLNGDSRIQQKGGHSFTAISAAHHTEKDDQRTRPKAWIRFLFRPEQQLTAHFAKGALKVEHKVTLQVNLKIKPKITLKVTLKVILKVTLKVTLMITQNVILKVALKVTFTATGS